MQSLLFSLLSVNAVAALVVANGRVVWDDFVKLDFCATSVDTRLVC
jgi:hypothetical protein